ncbi:MAG: hypothetical protein Q7S11_01390, partial [bacterium]|nr:hypothetical protein [bacterium]
MQRTQYSLRLWIIGSIFALFSSASFAIVLHDAVQATANLNTRSTPSASGTLIATMPSGSTGTTDNGSTVADGYTWWYMRWSTGQQGWSIQDYLTTVSPSLIAYSDKLEYGWYLYPWANTSANTLSSTHQYGTSGIQVTTYASWARLYLKTNGFNTATYGSQTLRFSVNGGSLAGQNLYVALYDTGGAPMQYVNVAAYVNGGNLSPAQWYDVAIPLTDINASNRIVGGFVIEAAQAMTFYVDDIWFPSFLSSTKWTPTAPTITGVSVNCSPSSIEIYQASQCNAIVNGTGSYNSAVTWSTNTGSINSSGFFTAPAYTTTATVTATSVQDASKSSTTYVTVTAPLPPQASQAGSIVYSETIGWGWDVGTWPNVI